MRQQIACAIEGKGGFLATGQSQLDGAPGLIPRPPVADQRIDENSGHGLVVHGASCIKIAVFLNQRKRVAFPVLAPGLHHVDMSEQENRVAVGFGTAKACDQVALLRPIGRHDDMDVLFGYAGIF